MKTTYRLYVKKFDRDLRTTQKGYINGGNHELYSEHSTLESLDKAAKSLALENKNCYDVVAEIEYYQVSNLKEEEKD